MPGMKFEVSHPVSKDPDQKVSIPLSLGLIVLITIHGLMANFW